MKILLILLSCLSVLSSLTFAETLKLPHETNTVNSNRKPVDEKQYENIIAEFHQYNATISQSARDEVVRYEKGLVTLTKQKTELYKSLSQEAQLYLAKRNGFKRKLPINKRRYIKQDRTNQN